MMKMIHVLTLIAGSMLAQACGASDQGEGVGGVSADEAQALNEAAAMLDARAANASAAINGTEPASASN